MRSILTPLLPLSCVLLALSLACGGGETSTDTPPATDTPATDAPATDAPATDAPATDDAEGDDGDGPGGAAIFKELDPELKKKFRALNKNLKTIPDAAAFSDRWEEADALAKDLEAALEKRGDCAGLDLEGLGKAVGMRVACIAEGTLPHVELPGWSEYAARSKEEVDDNFVSLMALAYKGGRQGGWPEWVIQMTDSSGCSALGTGKILEIFKAVDAVGSYREGEVKVIRAEVLEEIIGEHSPYCGLDGPTPDDKLKDEVKKVLAEVKLSAAEKKKIEAAIPKLKGEAFQGG